MKHYPQRVEGSMQDEHTMSQIAAMSIANLIAASKAERLADALPVIPTMIGTRLQLELLLQETTVDLSAISEVILSDPGATLQILRLIGEEYPTGEDRPTRMEDCLASLNMEHWYDAICASSMSPNSQVLAQWQHARRVAQCARELAMCVDGMAPEEAYLIGLLCEVGKLPQLLGWNSCGDSVTEQDAFALMLADYWHLPAYLLRAIQDQQAQNRHTHQSSTRWGEILQMARHVADQAQAAA
jgi:HD-like signal output (HDOD) protein